MASGKKLNSEEELQILNDMLKGKAGAFDFFYKTYRNLIISCILKVYGKYEYKLSEDDLADISGQVFLNIVKNDYHKLRLYDPSKGYKFSSWIGLIATNTSYDVLRKKGPNLTSLDDEDSYLPEPESIFNLPQDDLTEKEELKIINEAVNELSEGDRRFMELLYEHDLTPQEIAMHLGISINTVYSKKNKIKNKIIEIISKKSG